MAAVAAVAAVATVANENRRTGWRDLPLEEKKKEKDVASRVFECFAFAGHTS